MKTKQAQSQRIEIGPRSLYKFITDLHYSSWNSTEGGPPIPPMLAVIQDLRQYNFMSEVSELLKYGPRERVFSVIPDRVENKVLTWEGRGARLWVHKLAGDATFMAFVLSRVDNGGLGRGKRPIAIRAIPDNYPDLASDYVFYPEDTHDDIRLVEYKLPKDIPDPDEFLRGEWPIPYAYLNENGTNVGFAMARAVLGNVGATIEAGLGGEQTTFEKLEELPLREAGTPPFYQVSTI